MQCDYNRNTMKQILCLVLFCTPKTDHVERRSVSQSLLPRPSSEHDPSPKVGSRWRTESTPPPCGTLDIPRWQWYRWLMECIPPVYSLVIGCNRSWPIDGWIPWPHGLDPRQGHTGEGFIDLSFRCIPTEVSKIFGTTPWKNMENEIPCHGLSSYSKPKPTI